MNVNHDDTKRAKKIFVTAAIISIIALSPTLINGTPFFERANAQAMCFDENNTSLSPKSPDALPVILIHGYNEGPSVWSQWQHRLDHDGIRFCTVSFSFPLSFNDRCGPALAHADELSQIVQEVKSWTPHNKVNIVGHSKGGLDARQYLADSGTNDVANLVMIGTPNGGDPIANQVLLTPGLNFDFFDVSCRPALGDLEIGASDTQVPANPNTNYHTIAGNWDLHFTFCTFFWPLSLTSSNLHQLGDGAVPNDGLVPISSVESAPNSTSLGHTSNCHTDLLSDAEYTLSQDILRGGPS